VADSQVDVGDVRARLFNTGALFFRNPFQAEYEVPRGTGRRAMYASNLWVGGNVGGEFRFAGSSYSDWEFWPGPLDAGATLPNPNDCSAYDRIWRVSRSDIVVYNTTGVATPDMLDWPYQLGAPVLDGDGIPNNYDLAAGDQPAVWGDQTLWWVMNDVGNDHLQSETPPVGLEVQVTAFGVASGSDALTHATFYQYRLINRSAAPLEDAYVGLYSDVELGDATDDFVGTDTLAALTYVYNADNADGDGTGATYGTSPPAVGVQILGSPSGDAPPGGELGLTAAACWAKNGSTPLREPEDGVERYNCLKGLWVDGSPMTEGGLGYQTGPVTTFQFSGDPVAGTYWSELCPEQPCGAALFAGDRRMGASTGPFTLDAGEEEVFEFAIVFGQGTDHRNSVAALRAAAAEVQAAYGGGVLNPTPVAAAPGPGARILELSVPAPNPSSEVLTVRYQLREAARLRISLLDVLGREVLVGTDRMAMPGPGGASIDTRALDNGVYLIRVWVDGEPAAAMPVTVSR
jgi:hypothetical protein